MLTDAFFRLLSSLTDEEERTFSRPGKTVCPRFCLACRKQTRSFCFAKKNKPTARTARHPSLPLPMLHPLLNNKLLVYHHPHIPHCNSHALSSQHSTYIPDSVDWSSLSSPWQRAAGGHWGDQLTSPWCFMRRSTQSPGAIRHDVL